MDIDFLSNEWYEPHRRKVVWFTAVCDEKTIDCGVTIEALVEHFHAFQDDPLPAFRKHRQEIWFYGRQPYQPAPLRRRWHGADPQRRRATRLR